MKLFCILAVCMFMQFVNASFTIVIPDNAEKYDRFSANELASHLQKITKQQVNIISEKNYKKSIPVIFLGNTTQGRKAAENLKSPEAWRIFSPSENTLILTGSNPKGKLHSIYEFLERFADVRWFDEHNSSIPENKNFKLPSSVDISGKPYYRVRHIYDSLDWERNTHIFKARNKGQSYSTPEFADYSLVGAPAPHHTFHRYSRLFDPKKPEMYALVKGKGRLTDTKGQLCMTNPETRRQVLKLLRNFIKNDRIKAAKNNLPPPVIYDISANDTHSFCQCDGCQAIAVREGGAYSAPQLEFINHIATEIAKEYPDIFIRTFAYMHTYEPPKNLKAAKNVIIHIALLGTEFRNLGKRDTMSALNTPQNRDALRLIREWGKKADNLAMWDYWKLWGGHHEIQDPYINIYPIIYNMKIYKDNNIKDIFVECESPAETTFFGLKRYLGLRLMDDPARDPHKEIAIYMRGMYGDAAPIMKKYLDFLSENQAKSNLVLGQVSTYNRTDLNGQFYARAMQLLNEAHAIAAKDQNPLVKANVEREFIPVIGSWLARYPKLKNAKKDFSFSTMLADYEKYRRAAVKYYFKDSNNFKKQNQRITDAVRKLKMNMEPDKVILPAQLKNKKVTVLPYYRFRKISVAKIVDAKDSQFGKAIALGKEAKNKTMGNRTIFGIYSQNKKKTLASKSIHNSKLPKDGKFHLIHIGKATLSDENTYLYATHSWVIQCPLNAIYDREASDEENTYDFYLSVKFTGPFYVKGSKTTEDMISVDALYLVKAK